MSTKKKNVGRVPMRKCVCCELEKPKGEMTRIVISGRNTEINGVVKDDSGKQKGRGAYICRNKKCIEQAFENGLIDDETKAACLADMEKSKLQLLSIAMKAGRVAAGEYQCEEAIHKGDAFFVIIAEDASDNTRKKFEDKCHFYEVPFTIYGEKEELGRMIGKAERSVIAIKDESFGTQFITRFGGNE